MIGPTLPDDSAATQVTDASLPWVISGQLSSQHVARNKRLKSLVTKTPWLDRWEFEEVGRGLLSARNLPLRQKGHRISGMKRKLEDNKATSDGDFGEDSLCQAIDRVCVWKIRMDNKLPHAVESSFQLAQVLWRDYSSTISIEEVRLSYSCVILRTINGLADALQQQRSSAQSVAVLTAELGIPGWLVDCRHEATHNQLPKLGVLRLAATTLLEYFDRNYWQPQLSADSGTNEDPTRYPTTSSLVQKFLAYEKQQQKTEAMSSNLANKSSRQNNSSTKSSLDKATKSQQKHAPVLSAPDTGSSDDSGEEIYLDSYINPDTVWRPSSAQLGKTTNRFAALQEAPSKKKRKSKDKDKKAKPKANKEPSAHHHAKQFVKHGTHNLDLAYRAALLFLVWGGVEGAPVGKGALVPGSVTDFPETPDGIQKVWQRYKTLLVVLGKEWPGFLRALMVHIVDFILSIETTSASSSDAQASSKDSVVDAQSKRKLFFLESWVRFLVSRDFLSHFHPDLKSSRSKGSMPAPWSFVEPMRYPLNSQCDRLSVTPMHEHFSTSQGLAAFLIGVLGSHRVANHGLPVHVENSVSEMGPNPSIQSGLADQEDKQEVPLSAEDPNKPSEKLSLQEIEAMLSDDIPANTTKVDADSVNNVSDGAPTGETAATTAAALSTEPYEGHGAHQKVEPDCCPRPSWVMCTTWEPCAIGALPGYPCSS